MESTQSEAAAEDSAAETPAGIDADSGIECESAGECTDPKKGELRSPGSHKLKLKRKTSFSASPRLGKHRKGLKQSSGQLKAETMAKRMDKLCVLCESEPAGSLTARTPYCDCCKKDIDNASKEATRHKKTKGIEKAPEVFKQIRNGPLQGFRKFMAEWKAECGSGLAMRRGRFDWARFSKTYTAYITAAKGAKKVWMDQDMFICWQKFTKGKSEHAAVLNWKERGQKGRVQGFRGHSRVTHKGPMASVWDVLKCLGRNQVNSYYGSSEFINIQILISRFRLSTTEDSDSDSDSYFRIPEFINMISYANASQLKLFQFENQPGSCC